MHRALRVGLLSLAACLPVLVGACSLDNTGREESLGGRNTDSNIVNGFTNEVMPVLLRDCGFQACHGSSERFFRVWGPGRTRYEPNLMVCKKTGMNPPCNYDDVTPLERDFSMQFARSMVDLDDPSDSLLLRKPLAVERGGADHEGVDKYGRNVYRTPDDEGYRVISRWVYAYAESQKRLIAARATTPVATTPSATPPTTPPVTTPPTAAAP
jgi:hypothetical protein